MLQTMYDYFTCCFTKNENVVTEVDIGDKEKKKEIGSLIEAMRKSREHKHINEVVVNLDSVSISEGRSTSTSMNSLNKFKNNGDLISKNSTELLNINKKFIQDSIYTDTDCELDDLLIDDKYIREEEIGKIIFVINILLT